MPILLQRTPVTKRRSKPRRGGENDPIYRAWLIETFPLCILWDRVNTQCSGGSTIHHVRRNGEPRRDRRTVVLCCGHHMHDFGPHSIERLGRKEWERRFGIDLEIVIAETVHRYEMETRPNE